MAPARRQITQQQLEEYLRERRPEGGTYNIWHNRWKGLERDWSKKGLRAKFKCDPARDSGETVGSGNPNAYFCLYFAKGMCAQGPKCAMWHRIPTEKDEMETTIDCFGRDKFMEFRQDMGGVGSFNTMNRTLYVGRIAITDDMADAVRKHFEPWGEIEKLRLLKHRGVAFVTYTTRSNAEFAREAMMSQALENNEIVNVRWATVDQNAEQEGEEVDEVIEKKRQAVHEQTSDPRLDLEAELPAEFTHRKREAEEDNFQDLEAEAKRQKAEEEARQQIPYYDAQSAMAIYGYTQWPSAPAQPTPTPAPTASDNAKTGLLSQSVLESLKQLSRGTKTTATPPKTQVPEKKGAAVLGNLASYESDSDGDA